MAMNKTKENMKLNLDSIPRVKSVKTPGNRVRPKIPSKENRLMFSPNFLSQNPKTFNKFGEIKLDENENKDTVENKEKSLFVQSPLSC